MENHEKVEFLKSSYRTSSKHILINTVQYSMDAVFNTIGRKLIDMESLQNLKILKGTYTKSFYVLTMLLTSY